MKAFSTTVLGVSQEGCLQLKGAAGREQKMESPSTSKVRKRRCFQSKYSRELSVMRYHDISEDHLLSCTSDIRFT
jgi:hypothetical protein